MFSTETDNRIKKLNIVNFTAFGDLNEDDTNAILDSIEEHIKENPDNLKIAYMEYLKSKKWLQDNTDKMSYIDFKKNWNKGVENDKD